MGLRIRHFQSNDAFLIANERVLATIPPSHNQPVNRKSTYVCPFSIHVSEVRQIRPHHKPRRLNVSVGYRSDLDRLRFHRLEQSDQLDASASSRGERPRNYQLRQRSSDRAKSC